MKPTISSSPIGRVGPTREIWPPSMAVLTNSTTMEPSSSSPPRRTSATRWLLRPWVMAIRLMPRPRSIARQPLATITTMAGDASETRNGPIGGRAMAAKARNR